MKKIYSISAIIGCLMFSANVNAEESKIVIKPRVDVGYQYNSNFWKAEDEEVAVGTTYIKPGVTLGYETARTQISLDTALQAYWYDDIDTPSAGIQDSSDDDYVGFSGILSGNYQLTDRVNIGLSDEVYVTRDPAQADSNSNSVDRDKYTINYFEPSVYYELSDKFGLLAKYRNTLTDYEEDLEDSNENRGIFDIYYNLNRSSTIFLDYQFWKRDYDQTSSDYTSHLVTLNYQREFKHFTLTAGGGYHHRSFDESALDDLDMLSWNFQILRQDPDSTAQTSRSRLALDIGQDMNDDGTGDEYFTSTYARFSGAYRFTGKLEASASASYQNSDYEESTREDDKYKFSAKLAYQPLYFLTLGLEAGTETRDSNLAGYDYDDTFVLATIDIDYDFAKK